MSASQFPGGPLRDDGYHRIRQQGSRSASMLISGSARASVGRPIAEVAEPALSFARANIRKQEFDRYDR